MKALVKFWLQSHTPSTEPPPSFESWISEPGGGHHCDRPGHEWPYTCTPGTRVCHRLCELIRELGGNLTEVK